jgi:hypothetical protein
LQTFSSVGRARSEAQAAFLSVIESADCLTLATNPNTFVVVFMGPQDRHDRFAGERAA